MSLIARNIHKSFGKLHVLKGVDLEIGEAELVAIIGPSGAGKSTLLQILGSLSKPDQGEVIFQNRNLAQLSGNELAHIRNREIGYVFQFHHLLPEFSALENVSIPALIGGVSKKESYQRAEDLLIHLGLKDRLHHKPSELSGGEQQRVAVARALVNQPSILMADEPSGNLDSVNREELHKILLQLRKELNITILVVTHENNLASLADRTLLMRDGNIVEETVR
jgi:lipoprotein-releasing system ATP-binding protein